MSWWHSGDEEGNLALLETGDEPLYDLGNAYMALHRVGAAACEAVSKGPIPDEVSLLTALATARGAFAEPMVDSVSKSLGDPVYAGLLVRDAFDDAEAGALSLFRAAVAKQVPPPMAAQRAGLVFGVPSSAMGGFLKIATDPRAHPVAISDGADRVLFGHVAKVCQDELEQVSQEVSKATPDNPKERTQEQQLAEELMRQALRGGDDPTTPFYDARDARGRFVGDGDEKPPPPTAPPATTSGDPQRQPGESLVAFARRQRAAGVTEERQTRQTRQGRQTRQTRPEPTRAEEQRQAPQRQGVQRPQAKRGAPTRTTLDRLSLPRTVRPQTDEEREGPKPTQVVPTQDLMENPDPGDQTLYTRRDTTMAVVMTAKDARRFLAAAPGEFETRADNPKRFRLGHLAEAAGVENFIPHDSNVSYKTDAYRENIVAAADKAYDQVPNDSPYVAPPTSYRLPASAAPVEIERTKEALARTYLEDQLGLSPYGEKFDRELIRQMDRVMPTPTADGSSDVEFVHLPVGMSPDDVTVTEFIASRGVEVAANKPGTPRANRNQAWRLSVRPVETFYDSNEHIFRRRIYLEPVDENKALEYRQRFGKADPPRVRQFNADLAESLMRQAEQWQEEEHPRDGEGRFTEVRQERQTRQAREQRQTRPEPVRTEQRRTTPERQGQERQSQQRTAPSRTPLPRKIAERLAQLPPDKPDFTLSNESNYTVLSADGMRQLVGWVAQPAKAKNPQRITLKGGHKDVLLTSVIDGHSAEDEIRNITQAHLDEEWNGEDDVIAPQTPLGPPIYINVDDRSSLINFRKHANDQFRKRPGLIALSVEQLEDSDLFSLYGQYTRRTPPPVQLIRHTQAAYDNPDAQMELVYEGETDSTKIAHEEPRIDASGPVNTRVDVYRLQPISVDRGEESPAVLEGPRYPHEGGRPLGHPRRH